MSDPLHTTNIGDHPQFTSGGTTTTVKTSVTWPPKYPSIFIGRKPLKVYVEAAQRELKKGVFLGGVWIEARGDLVSRAILVAMRVVRSSSSILILSPVVGTVNLKGRDDKEREVPTIAILVQPPQPPTIATWVPNVEPIPFVPTPNFDPFHPSYTGDPQPPQPVITINADVRD